MKLQKQLTRYFDGSRLAALFSIAAGVVLSALVAGASIYLFLAAGRAQLPTPVVGEIMAAALVGALPAPVVGEIMAPAPVVGEIMAPAPVVALPAPPPIQIPPTVEALAPETLVAGPFLVAAISQPAPAGNESARARAVAAETGAVTGVVTGVVAGVVASPAGINGDLPQSASSPVVAQSEGSANNIDNHDSGDHNSGGNNAHDSAYHNSGSKEHHDGATGAAKPRRRGDRRG